MDQPAWRLRQNRCDGWEARIMRQPWACPVMIKIARFKRASCRFFIPLLPHDSVAFVFFCQLQCCRKVARTQTHRENTKAHDRFRDKRLAAACSVQQATLEQDRTIQNLFMFALLLTTSTCAAFRSHIQKIIMLTHAKMLHKKWNCIKKLLQEIASTNCLNKLPQQIASTN